MVSQWKKLPFLFGVGGASYYGLELAFRHYSHYSMFLLGGLCFVIIGLLEKTDFAKRSYLALMAVSSIIITLLEFFTGLVVNRMLNLNVWDYSDQPFNLMGQICLLFTVIWFFLSYGAIALDVTVRRLFFHERRELGGF